MERLPEELVNLIFRTIHTTLSAKDLATCLLVNHEWHEQTYPLLYQDIVLSTLSLPIFLLVQSQPNGLRRGGLAHTQSLTLKMGAPGGRVVNNFSTLEEAESTRDNGSAPTHQLWQQLRDLIPHIKSMTNLASFSLCRVSRPEIGFWLPRPLIAEIVDSLPQSLANLELDTNDYDLDRPGDQHLCQSIRQTFSHLRHLRLHLRSLCPALFTVSGQLMDPNDSEILSAPELRTVTIGCDNRFSRSQESCKCGTHIEQPWGRYGSSETPKARVALSETLSHLVKMGAFPKIEQLNLLDMTYGDIRDLRVCSSHNTRDVLRNKTVKMPILPMSGVTLIWMMRLMDESEIYGRAPTVADIAGGRLWVETSNGSRLPMRVAVNRYQRGIGAKVDDLEIWDRKENERITRTKLPLCSWEQTVGQRLVGAEEWDDLFVDQSVMVKIPDGWRLDGTELVRSSALEGVAS